MYRVTRLQDMMQALNVGLVLHERLMFLTIFCFILAII